VVTGDERLETALRSLLAAVAGATVVECACAESGDCADIVVTTVSDRSPAQVRELAQAGLRVLVLAPVARARQAQAYLGAGASAYLVMATDGLELLESVRAALIVPHEE